ncbi:UDP-glucose 4-epimerase [Novimethylophilus kurashikiensis]|uniref:UDP-glucose 4-epimerase n=1 Tax=Novimethylophilus kurashikiensis TaxID=1825523 RepID=A0A2R5F4E4_9PROT|nr:NAD-dependent epimerase/dehydratase family protein [Novimethylophilus kurashikiensis]GBG13300.1 UDP-glucose 4-epimerase [Novimethylophilus kurashikiensis]
MRTCIIGGSGFIGRYLAQALVETGRDVIAIGRRSNPEFLPSGCEYVSCDYANRPLLRQILHTCDEIVDLAYATVPQTSFADPINDIQANLYPSVGLLEEACALGTKLRKLLIVSSGGTVYGLVEDLPISEETALAPVSPYGITKLTIERYAMMFHRLHGLPVTIVRPANAYGVGQKPFMGQGFIATAMGYILRGEEVVIFGTRGTIRDYIHVKDIASGIVAALEKGSCGTAYNIGTGIGRDNQEVLETLSPLVTKSGYSVYIRTEATRRFDVPANILDSKSLRECSGWHPNVSFEKGIEEMWNKLISE